MYSSFLYIVGTVLSLLVALSTAIFDNAARTNVAVYYGQGPNQQNLLRYCQQSSIDIIPLAFVNIFPAQGNGFPGTNFGNRCWGGTYQGPGYNGIKSPARDALQSQCPSLVQDIPICQAQYGKKIILSLGGGFNTYQLTGATDGRIFADFLWGAFGPRTASWVSRGLPRPFDGPNGQAVEVDGFDFDIEFPSRDNSAGYIAMVTRLRGLFATSPKRYLITGSPQCVVPDANMAAMIRNAQFDILWIQFYNTPSCSARTWISSSGAGFTFDAWARSLVGTASANAKLYIGLPGSPAGAANPSFYLTPGEASRLIGGFYCRPNFGGIMLWEATYADNNVNSGQRYYQWMKSILNGLARNPNVVCRP